MAGAPAGLAPVAAFVLPAGCADLASSVALLGATLDAFYVVFGGTTWAGLVAAVVADVALLD